MNEHTTVPILRLELQRASQTIMIAIQDELLQLDEDIRTAIQAVCTPEHIQKVVREAVTRHLRSAIESQIHDYFNYSGEGHKVIKKAIAKRLADQAFD